MPHKFIRKLFISVCLPRMLYGCDVFCAYKIASPDTKSGLIPRLARVQRAAALQITGALKSSPNDSLDIHADLDPLKHTIRKFCYQAAVRMCTLPQSHPLHLPIRLAARRYIKLHRSPLHELMGTFHLHPETIETITPARRDPAQPFPVITSVEDDIVFPDVDVYGSTYPPDPVHIHMDGSGINNMIGSAAVIAGKHPSRGVQRYQLGAMSHHTVYEGEIVGLLLALELVRDLVKFGFIPSFYILDRKSTRLNSSHSGESRMPSSA